MSEIIGSSREQASFVDFEEGTEFEKLRKRKREAYEIDSLDRENRREELKQEENEMMQRERERSIKMAGVEERVALMDKIYARFLELSGTEQSLEHPTQDHREALCTMKACLLRMLARVCVM
jgi:hypothetical protein